MSSERLKRFKYGLGVTCLVASPFLIGCEAPRGRSLSMETQIGSSRALRGVNAEDYYLPDKYNFYDCSRSQVHLPGPKGWSRIYQENGDLPTDLPTCVLVTGSPDEYGVYENEIKVTAMAGFSRKNDGVHPSRMDGYLSAGSRCTGGATFGGECIADAGKFKDSLADKSN